jgi:hypothetical protein
MRFSSASGSKCVVMPFSTSNPSAASLFCFVFGIRWPGRLSRQAGQHLRVNADGGQPALAAVLDGQGVVLQIFFEPAGENRDEL